MKRERLFHYSFERSNDDGKTWKSLTGIAPSKEDSDLEYTTKLWVEYYKDTPYSKFRWVKSVITTTHKIISLDESSLKP